MSRALDKATVAALQSGNPDAAYQAIADVLTPPSPSSSPAQRLELEFLGHEFLPLPASSPYYLRDGNAVAIPKLVLVLAFVVARRVLQQQQQKDVPEDELLRATAVLLMMDPEHLTAANTRKRILQARLRQFPDTTASIVARELALIDSMLTGHLHRHTKSPTLWNHRRWLLSVAVSVVDPLRDITEVVLVAAERHPRNYYAWDHARWLVRAAAAAAETENKRALALAVRTWCYRHHTDTSGWSFLLFLLASKDGDTSPVSSSPLLAETVAEVEQMATSLRWTGEAVWVFLRTAVAYLALAGSEAAAPSLSSSSYTQFQQTVAALQQRAGATSREHQVLQQAQDWCAATIQSR